MKKTLLAVGLGLLLASCGGITRTEVSNEKTQQPTQATVTEPASQPVAEVEKPETKLTAQVKNGGGFYAPVLYTDGIGKDGKSLNFNLNVKQVNIWDTDRSDHDQHWVLETYEDSRGDYFLIRRRDTNLCLNAHRPWLRNDMKINTWTCNHNDIDQQWVLHAGWGSGQTADDGYIYGYHRGQIRARDTNYCLNVIGRDNWTRVGVWNCDPTDAVHANQMWHMGLTTNPAR